jgi:hypothetical protein
MTRVTDSNSSSVGDGRLPPLAPDDSDSVLANHDGLPDAGPTVATRGPYA